MKQIAKRSLAMLLCAVMLLGMIPTVAFATEVASGSCGSSTTWVLDSEGTLTVSGTGAISAYSEDNAPWSSYSDQIKTVVIAEGITKIGKYAFSGCRNMTTLVFPSTVTSMGHSAFYGCFNLSEIYLSDIAAYLSISDPEYDWVGRFWPAELPAEFSECEKNFYLNGKLLTDLVIPDGLNYFASQAFYKCTSLTSVTIPDSVTEIGSKTFMGCSNLISVSIGNGVSSIGDCAFWMCSNLENVTLGNSITDIGEFAFKDCPNLKNTIILPTTVTTLGNHAFGNCTNLKNIIFKGDAPTCESVYVFDAVKANMHYPADNATWTAETIDSMSASSTLNWTGYINVITPVVTVAQYELGEGAELRWENLDGAAKHEIYRSTNTADEYEKIATISNALSYVDNTVSPGNDYYYKVKALAADGTASLFSTAKSFSPVMYDPELTVTLDSSGNVKLTWNDVVYAESYQVCRKESESGTTYNRLTTTTETSYTDTSAEAGKTYYYCIWAKAEGDYYTRSLDVACSSEMVRPTVTAKNTASSGKIKLTWNEISGAEKYVVYRSTSKNGTYKKLKTTTATSYTDTSATAGKTYYYKVKAIGQSTTTSAAVKCVCDLARPAVTSKNTASTGKVKLSWKAIDGAEKYIVYRATSKNGEYKKLKTTTKTSYTDSSAKVGKTYYYKVIAVHEKSPANSAYSKVVSGVRDLPQPDVSVKVKSNGDPRVSWDKVSGASKYVVYRATSKNGEYKKLKTTAKLAYVDASAKAGKTYYYKVVAIHSTSAANSAASAVVKAKAK